MADWLQYVNVGLLGVGALYLRSLTVEQAKFDARLENLDITRLDAGAHKQGEFDAINANLETIKGHVETTERTTATIKSEFETALWQKRELATLLRTKLEEMLFASAEISAREDEEWNLATAGNPSVRPDPGVKVDVLSSLYFRRLRPEASAVTAAAGQLNVTATKVRAALARRTVALQGVTDKGAMTVIYERHLAEYTSLADERVARRKALAAAQAILLGKAGAVINEIFEQDIGLAFDYSPYFAAAPKFEEVASGKDREDSGSKG